MADGNLNVTVNVDLDRSDATLSLIAGLHMLCQDNELVTTSDIDGLIDRWLTEVPQSRADGLSALTQTMRDQRSELKRLRGE